jgi:hypothetical protein
MGYDENFLQMKDNDGNVTYDLVGAAIYNGKAHYWSIVNYLGAWYWFNLSGYTKFNTV